MFIVKCQFFRFVLLFCRYVVLTSKHHDGYTLWPSKYSFSWNSMDVGPHRDIIKELADAIRTNTSIKFGLYHSLYEWFHPIYLEDKRNEFKTNEFVTNKVRKDFYSFFNENIYIPMNGLFSLIL